MILTALDNRKGPHTLMFPALFTAYNSFVSEKIEDFNISFYYDAPQNILNTYLTDIIE